MYTCITAAQQERLTILIKLGLIRALYQQQLITPVQFDRMMQLQRGR